MESWVDIYRKLFESGKVQIVKLPPGLCTGGAGGEGEEDDENDQGKGNNPGGKGKGKSGKEGEDENEGAIVDTGTQKGFDEHLDPGTAQAKTRRKRKPSATSMVSGRPRSLQGWRLQKLRVSCPRTRGDLLARALAPKVDWKDRIRALVMRRGVGRVFVARTRPAADRAWPGAPGRLGYTCGVIVIGVDTSGSTRGGAAQDARDVLR